MSIICDFELFSIEEYGCIESFRVKTKHKGKFRYKGATACIGINQFQHLFESDKGCELSFFTDSEYIEGLEEGKEIELEYEL